MAKNHVNTGACLDFLIAASPTPGMLSQIAFFRMCLDALGGAYADARLVATLGDHEVEALPGNWRRYFDNIQVEWSHAPGAANPLYRAQHDRRFSIIRPNADLAILCDADVAPLRQFDGLISELVAQPALAGVIAHYPFVLGSDHSVPIDQRTPGKDWRELSLKYIGKAIDCPNRFTMMPTDSDFRAPFYLNYGVVAGTPDIFAEFHRHDIRLRNLISPDAGDFWGPQISVALAVADGDLPSRTLPMRYNFPNDPIADRLYPDELTEVVFMHYLRHNIFDRNRIFSSPECFQAFLGSDLSGSNEIFRCFVERVTDGVFPFG